MVKQNGDKPPHPVIAEFNADVFLAEIDESVLRTVMNGYVSVAIEPVEGALRLTIQRKETVFTGPPEEACRIIAAFFLKAAMTIPKIREADRFSSSRKEAAQIAENCDTAEIDPWEETQDA